MTAKPTTPAEGGSYVVNPDGTVDRIAFTAPADTESRPAPPAREQQPADEPPARHKRRGAPAGATGKQNKETT